MSLPEGWVERFDEKHQRPFYFNKRTKQSQWRRPGPSNEGVGSTTATTRTPDASPNANATTTTKSAKVSPSSNAVGDTANTSANASNKSRQWSMVYTPTEAERITIVTSSALGGGDSIAQITPTGGDEASSTVSSSSSRGNAGGSRRPPPLPPNTPPSAGVPNHRPASGIIHSPSSSSLGSSASHPNHHHPIGNYVAATNSSSSPSSSTVASTWIQVFSEVHQKYYYYNPKTGKTTWRRPSASVVTPPPPRPPPATSSSSSHGAGEEEEEDDEEEEEEEEEGDNDDDLDELESAGGASEPGSTLSGGSKSTPPSLFLPTSPGRVPPGITATTSAEEFQRQIMEQFPALKLAFERLEDGQRQLEEQRREHARQMAAQIEELNRKMGEIKAAAAVASTSPSSPRSAQETGAGDRSSLVSAERRVGGLPRAARAHRTSQLLDEQLQRFSTDLQRRSLSAASRQSLRMSMSGGGGRGLDVNAELKRVQEAAAKFHAGEETTKLDGTGERAKEKEEEEVEEEEEEESRATSDEGAGLEDEMRELESGIAAATAESRAQKAAQEEVERLENDDFAYYHLLGVGEEATDAELKRAFHTQLKKWHPDKVAKDPSAQREAARRVDQINAAYKVLSDPWEREVYGFFGLEQYLVHVKVLSSFKNYLIQGIELVKHPRKGWPQRRTLWLDPGLQEFKMHRRKVTFDAADPTGSARRARGVRSFPISSITSVVRGISTDVLKKTGRKKRADRYFSLILADRTLDLEAASAETADFIATRLTLLVIDLNRDQKWMYRYYGKEGEDE